VASLYPTRKSTAPIQNNGPVMEQKIESLISSIQAMTVEMKKSNERQNKTNEKLDKLCDALAGVKTTVDQHEKDIAFLKVTAEEQGRSIHVVNKFLNNMFAAQTDFMERVEYSMEKETIQTIVIAKVRNIYSLDDVVDFLEEKHVIEAGTKPHNFSFTNPNIPGYKFYRLQMARPQQAAETYKHREDFKSKFSGWLQHETTKSGTFRRRLQAKFAKTFNERAPSMCKLRYSYVLINGHNIGHVRYIPEDEAAWPNLIRELLSLKSLKTPNPDDGKRIDMKSVLPGPQAVSF